MKTTLASLTIGLAVAGMTLLSGCSEPETAAPAPSPTDSSLTPDAHGHDHGEEGHGHGAGPHDGTLADWGGGAYHVEFTVDHDKQEATVYILGSDEKTPEPIATESLLLTIKEPELQAELMPAPLDGESDGKSSRFVGTHEGQATVMEYEGTISGEVDGTPYVGEFKEEPHGH